ncbi:hypothetical protein ACEZDB_37135 [Streptacidiphilus sp. N1-3]|uniref:Uncharacterized protein n=1 Tax=Streptacidiphilus alkalitolerans TaxID=3342712 RepID=A0ABV6XEC5_9ACTN
MPQNLFEPRRPVARNRPPGFAAGPLPMPEEPVEPDGPVEQQAPGREPSWLRVYWNTFRSFARRRLGLGPRPPQIRQGGRSTGRIVLTVLAGIIVVIGLAGAGVALGGKQGSGTQGGGTTRPQAAPLASGPGTTGTEPSGVPSPAVRTQVAQWVIADIGPGNLVACDAALCGTLASLGFPLSSLVPVGDSADALQGADAVLVTATLRSRLGDALTALTADQPLAEFGTGAQVVTVQPIAHAGRAAYTRQLATDVAEREQAGTALLSNSRIVFAPQARLQISQGLVDLRVCAVLATLGTGHVLTVSSFGPTAPGAGPAIPLTGLEITTIDHRPATGTGPQARALRTLIGAQQPPYRPLSTSTVAAHGDSAAALLLRYSEPGPLAPAQ